MTDIEIFARMLLALGFGAILGLETETRAEIAKSKKTAQEKERAMRRSIGGVRTYTVLALFGALSGLLFASGYPVFAYMMFVAVFLIVLAAYILNVQYQKAFGMTTELAILITVLVGFAATANVIPLQILVIIIVILTYILSQKRGIGKLARKIAHEELIDVVKFAIVALVVAPFLPNQDLFLSDVAGLSELLHAIGITGDALQHLVIINPFKLWQYVILISGFNLMGYVANRLVGKAKGLLLTGAFGGFVSSTSTVIALAFRSRGVDSKYMWHSLGGTALIAHAVSFLQILVLAASTSLLFFTGVFPASAGMAIGSLLVGLWFMRNSNKVEDVVEVDLKPFSIRPALQFALLLTVVRIILQLVNAFLGSSTFVFVTALSGVLGMDIATITLGELVFQSQITIDVAVITFVAANAVNFAAKVFYSAMQGKSTFVRVVGLGMLMSFIGGIMGALASLTGV